MRAQAVLLVALLPVTALAQAEVTATGQTLPVPTAGQTLNDTALWLPAETGQSLVFGTEPQNGGIFSWSLDGGLTQFLFQGPTSAIDVRYGFAVDAGTFPLFVSTELSSGQMNFLSIDAGSQQLFNIAARPILTGRVVAAAALYLSPNGGTFAFVADTGGEIDQWEVFSDGGLVDAVKVRTFSVGSGVSAIVADDLHRWLFVSENTGRLLRFDAEPDAGFAAEVVDEPDAGNLFPPLRGVALYQTAGGGGYLLVSSQGDDTFVVYDRNPPHAQRLRFRIVAGDGGIGGASGTTAIEVTNLGLGASFPQGLFVAHDAFNVTRPNFKLVPWERIAAAATPPLEVDPIFDPRLPPGGGATDGGADGGGTAGAGGLLLFPGSGPVVEESTCGACSSTGLWVWGPLTALFALARRRRSGS